MGAIKVFLVILLILCAIWGFMTLNMPLLIGGTFSVLIALVFVEWMIDVREELEKQTKVLEAICKKFESESTNGVQELTKMETVIMGIRDDLKDMKAMVKDRQDDPVDQYEAVDSVSPDMSKRRR